jgi:hypothetical protein
METVLRYFLVATLHLLIAEVSIAQFVDTIRFKTFVKTCKFAYKNDSVFSLKIYIRQNGYYHFNEDDEVGRMWIVKKKGVIPCQEIFVKSDTTIETIPSYFPNGLREDCIGCNFAHAYRLHLFSEQPIYRILEDNLIRISYEDVPADNPFRNKPVTYYLIKVVFKTDSAIMQYKEGTFVDDKFYCYKNDEFILSKKEMEQISKLDQKISWYLEPYDCISDEDKNGIIERKNGNFFFSCVRNGYCTNIEKKSLISMLQFITTIQKIKSDKLKYKMIERFPNG